MRHLLIDSKKQVINSEINRPPYRGNVYPSFQEVQNLAMQYRAHGERVYIRTSLLINIY